MRSLSALRRCAAWSVLALTALAGCATTFTVKEMDTRFSPSKDRVLVGEGNRLSRKTILGGIHVDDEGLYLNPVAVVSPEGQVRELGLAVVHVQKGVLKALSAGPRVQYAPTPQYGIFLTVTFRLPDGSLIEAQALDRRLTPFWLRELGVREVAFVPLTPEQFRRLAEAERVAVQVVGTEASVVFEESDVLPEWRANLRQFYQEHVARLGTPPR